MEKLINSFSRNKIDAYLAVNNINISYLTESPCEESWLFVTKKGCSYITDSRYLLEAKKNLKEIKVIEYKNSIKDPLINIINKLNTKRIGFDVNRS